MKKPTKRNLEVYKVLIDEALNRKIIRLKFLKEKLEITNKAIINHLERLEECNLVTLGKEPFDLVMDMKVFVEMDEIEKKEGSDKFIYDQCSDIYSLGRYLVYYN